LQWEEGTPAMSRHSLLTCQLLTSINNRNLIVINTHINSPYGHASLFQSFVHGFFDLGQHNLAAQFDVLAGGFGCIHLKGRMAKTFGVQS